MIMYFVFGENVLNILFFCLFIFFFIGRCFINVVVVFGFKIIVNILEFIFV